MKPLTKISAFLAGTIVVVFAGLVMTTTALPPTDTTPIPRPMPPGGGGDGGYYEDEYPKATLVYDKATPDDAIKAFRTVGKQVDWLTFKRNKTSGFFSDKELNDRYKDKTPAYEFLSDNKVLVADITNTALTEEELKAVCDSLRGKLESQDVIFRMYLGKQSFTPVGMSDNVIFQIHDDMLTLFSKALGAGKDYTLVSVTSHENESRDSIFAAANQTARSNNVSLILVDNLDWRNMKILQTLAVTSGAPTVHLLIGKDGKVYGSLEKSNPTLDELTEFVKSQLPANP